MEIRLDLSDKLIIMIFSAFFEASGSGKNKLLASCDFRPLSKALQRTKIKKVEFNLKEPLLQSKSS